MKNLKKVIAAALFILMTMHFGTAAEKIENQVISDPIEEYTLGNATLDRLVSKINDGFIFSAHISSTTIKKEKNIEKAFTTFASGGLKLLKDGSVKIEKVATAFNDRDNFQGKKTLESISLSSRGNNIQIKMQFHTWAQQQVTLSNVKITKERFGYFLTGSQLNGNKTVYYTIAIYHQGRLI